MSVSKIGFWASITLFTAIPLAHAASNPAPVYSPAKGHPERKAILDIVRPVAEHDLGKPVEFVVEEFNISGNWAFVALNAQRPGGGKIDPYKTPFASRNGEDAVSMFDCCHVEAVLRKEQGAWRVLESGVGTTDVWYTNWCDKVPQGLIGICAAFAQ